MPSTSFLFAGTESGLTVFSFAGEQWIISSRMLVQEKIFALAINHHNPVTMLACTRNGIFRTTDGGSTWINALPVSGASLTGAGRDVFFAGTTTGELWKTSDSGATWACILDSSSEIECIEDWFPPQRADDPIISALGYEPYSGTLAAGIVHGGLIRSLDLGNSWLNTDDLTGEAILQIVPPQKTNGHWLARSEDCIFFSADGEDWEVMEVGLDHIFCSSITTSNDGNCWAVAGDVPIGNWVENAATALYRADRAGGVWQRTFFPEMEYVTCLASSSLGMLGGTYNGAIFLQQHNKNWEKIGQASGAIQSLTLLPSG